MRNRRENCVLLLFIISFRMRFYNVSTPFSIVVLKFIYIENGWFGCRATSKENKYLQSFHNNSHQWMFKLLLTDFSVDAHSNSRWRTYTNAFFSRAETIEIAAVLIFSK